MHALTYYNFALKFGWTPDVVDDLPAQTVDDFKLIMAYEQRLGPKPPEVPPYGRA